jgi:proton-translocating NADH-quinone oxidoreductase chain L
MYINILLLPLLNFLIISFFGFYIGRWGSCFISILGLSLSFFLSIFIFFEVVINQIPTSIKLYNWLYIDIYSIQIGFFFDTISCIMLLVISFISLIVHLYSITYLIDDPFISRFMAYLSLFTFFMLLLVTSDNFLQLFIGWEGVGLLSYLLINFWFTRILANKAALKAMIMNRIADVIFLFAIIFFLLKFKTTDFNIIFNLIPFIFEDIYYFLFKTFNIIELISFFILIGAIGKSAQIGFHTWLPDAMEGPTPVSALLHAATMVTAGVFLIIRCSFIVEYSEVILSLLILIGCITTFFAGFVAIFQYDIKKIIAYSTCSQLGYMFIACGLSNYNLAMFHLFNHAFFKALLFLSAGSIIHAFFDEQDMRKFGGNILIIMPFTYICFIIGSLSIMGFPFLTGFFSKELIIDLSYKKYFIDSNFTYIICIFSAVFTIIYSCKLLAYTFIVRSINGFKNNYKNFTKIFIEGYDFMFYSMLILSIMSIYIGYLFNDLFIGIGISIWNNSIFILPYHYNIYNYIFLPLYIKDFPLLFSFIGIIYLIHFFKIKRRNSQNILEFINCYKRQFKFYFIEILNYLNNLEFISFYKKQFKFYFIEIKNYFYYKIELIILSIIVIFMIIYYIWWYDDKFFFKIEFFIIINLIFNITYLYPFYIICDFEFYKQPLKIYFIKIKNYFYYKIYFNMFYIGYNAFFFNNFYNYIYIYFYKLSYLINIKNLDKGLFEYFGPFGIYKLEEFFLNIGNFFFFGRIIYFSLFLKFFYIFIIIKIFLFYFFLFYFLNIGLLIIIFIYLLIENLFKFSFK